LIAAGSGFDVSTKPIVARCTPAGGSVFVGANCAAPVAIDEGWAYGSTATDAATVPLLVDDAGTVYAATRSYPDGREALVLTFAQSPTALHTLELGYGVVHWLTRGLFVGEQHVYLSPQIDDLFSRQARTLDAAERKKLIHQIETRVLENAYFMPGLWWTRNLVHWTKVKNYVAPPNHYTNQKLQDVWLSED